MAGKKQSDNFANIAYLAVTESAANTLTFAQLALANNLMTEKVALVIHRAEFYINSINELNSVGDWTSLGLTLSDRVTSLTDLSQPEILFMSRIERIEFGAAIATGILNIVPVIRDFTSLPGGGLLVPADRLYIGCKSSGAANAQTVFMRLYYTVKPLETAEYWELIEARRVMTT